MEAPQLPPLELPPSICKKSFSLDAVALEAGDYRWRLAIRFRGLLLVVFFFDWVVWGRCEVQYSTAAGGLESYSME